MPNYQNGLVYKIQHNSIDELLYVGSTTEFTKRKHLHKSKCKNDTSKKYVMIRENGGWENFTMTLVKYFPCNTKRELEAEEEKVRRELNASLNSIRSYRTEQELNNYYQDNKEHIKEQKKQYYQDNKEQINEYKKQYYQDNKEQINEKDKQYYQDNKEKIKERLKEKIICDCGSIVSRTHMARHKQSKFHLKWEANCI
jgi:hypothetical protein